LMEEKLQARGLEVEELAQRLAAAEALISQLTAQVGEEADSLEASAERWGEGAAAGDTDDATVRALVLEPLVAAAAAEEQAGEEAPQPQLPPELQPEQQAGEQQAPPELQPEQQAGEQQAPPELQPEQQGAGGEAGTPMLRKIIDEAGQLFGECEGAVLSPSHVLRYVDQGSVEDVRLLAALRLPGFEIVGAEFPSRDAADARNSNLLFLGDTLTRKGIKWAERWHLAPEVVKGCYLHTTAAARELHREVGLLTQAATVVLLHERFKQGLGQLPQPPQFLLTCTLFEGRSELDGLAPVAYLYLPDRRSKHIRRYANVSGLQRAWTTPSFLEAVKELPEVADEQLL
ncbi:hypothetical protein COHA_004690, partial [Chlorella ohadii]